MSTIAGHTFVWTGHGDICSCGKRRVDLCGITRADIGKPGWAHYGDLSAHEYEQVVAMLERMWLAGAGV